LDRQFQDVLEVYEIQEPYLEHDYLDRWARSLGIDDLLEMIPELRENACVYIDAFLGARMKDQQGPISPYLGYSKEEEAQTMRKILRYWRDQGVDPGVEHAWGMRGERCVGLTPYAADSRHLDDLPDSLYTTWVFAWDVHKAREGFKNLWDANIFCPSKGTLAYSEHLLGYLIFLIPLSLFTNNIYLMANIKNEIMIRSLTCPSCS